MKTRAICALLSVMILMLLPGCGGDGGSGSGTGTVSMDIADAKPFIAGPEPNELWLVFEEVLIHKSRGGWVSGKLPKTPFEINLLAFSGGLKTRLVTPTQVTAGHITQMRFVLSRAYMVFYGNPDVTTDIDLDVPGFLRTDKQCDWQVAEGWALDYTVHFDLSKSIVQTGPDEYKLKPVIHLFDNNPQEAAMIVGNIHPDSFGPPADVLVTVTWNGCEPESEPETYTTVTVARESESDPTTFRIFWLVPLAFNESCTESYTVQIDDGNGVNIYDETVEYPKLGPGDSFELNSGEAIPISTS